MAAVDWFLGILTGHPEVAFFLTIGIGYLLGRLRIGSFALGSVTGTLLAGVLIGQFGIRISDEVKQCFFLLFLFAIGFRTGPQFFRGLRSDGAAQAGLAAIVATSGLLVAWLVSLALGYSAGTGGGLLAGALTESATIGTAGDAIRHLDLPQQARDGLQNQIPVAFAVTYLVGVIGAAWFLSQIGPRLMGVDLVQACRELEQRLQLAHDQPGVAVRRPFELRTFAVQAHSPWRGRSVASVERDFPLPKRVFVEGILRGEVRIDPGMEDQIRSGDVLALSGRRDVLVELDRSPDAGLVEVDDLRLAADRADVVDVVVTSRAMDGRRLVDLAAEPAARGLFLQDLSRNGQSLPRTDWLDVQVGDVVTLVGSPAHTAAAIATLGYADRPTEQTNVAFVALGIVAGAVVGIPALTLGHLELGLSLSVGVLLGGLVCGWLRSVKPFFGRVPAPTLWIFESIGLAGFVAVAGLAAGPDFVAGLRTSGLSLILAGAVTVLVPHLLGVVVGYRLLKLHPGVVLGVCAGAGTATPALAAIQEAAKSTVPTLGYGVAYAVGNVLLALWGTVIVALLA